MHPAGPANEQQAAAGPDPAKPDAPGPMAPSTTFGGGPWFHAEADAVIDDWAPGAPACMDKNLTTDPAMLTAPLDAADASSMQHRTEGMAFPRTAPVASPEDLARMEQAQMHMHAQARMQGQGQVHAGDVASTPKAGFAGPSSGSRDTSGGQCSASGIPLGRSGMADSGSGSDGITSSSFAVGQAPSYADIHSYAWPAGGGGGAGAGAGEDVVEGVGDMEGSQGQWGHGEVA